MEFISKELAIKLKEKGFYLPTFEIIGKYDSDGIFHSQLYCNYTDTMDCDEIITPTIEQVLEWLRKDKDIHIKLDICFRYTSEHKKDKNGTYSGYMDVSEPFWSFLIRKIKNGNCLYDNTTASNNEYLSYEDACIAGIEYVVNNLI